MFLSVFFIAYFKTRKMCILYDKKVLESSVVIISSIVN